MRSWVRPSIETLVVLVLIFFGIAAVGLFIAAIVMGDDTTLYNRLSAAAGIATGGTILAAVPVGVINAIRHMRTSEKSLHEKHDDVDSKDSQLTSAMEEGRSAVGKLKDRKEYYESKAASWRKLLSQLPDISEPDKAAYEDEDGDVYQQDLRKYLEAKDYRKNFRKRLEKFEGLVDPLDESIEDLGGAMSAAEDLCNELRKLAKQLKDESKKATSGMPNESDLGDGGSDSAANDGGTQDPATSDDGT